MLDAILEQLAAEAIALAVRSGCQGIVDRFALPTSTARPAAMPDFSVVSVLPGRVRVRVRAVHRDVACAARVRWALGALSGVSRADVNETTGSVLVSYDRDMTDLAAVLRVLSAAIRRAAPVGRGADRHAPVAIALSMTTR